MRGVALNPGKKKQDVLVKTCLSNTSTQCGANFCTFDAKYHCAIRHYTLIHKCSQLNGKLKPTFPTSKSMEHKFPNMYIPGGWRGM